MRFVLVCVAAASLLSACGPKGDVQSGKASETAIAGGSASDTAAPAAAGFTLGALSDDEGQVQGCQTMLSNEGDVEIFRASAADNDAPGFVKIDGKLVELNLVSSKGDEKSHERVFESADKTTSVVEKLTSGKAYPESDSVEQSGTLDVTHNGVKQSLKVVGGTAC